MFTAKWRRGAGVFALAALLAFSGCIFGTDGEDDSPKEPTPDFRALTSKDNVIHNLLESYKWADIDHFVELLHADYIWYNQAEDVAFSGLPEFYARAEDIEMTANLFEAKLGIHPDSTKHLERLVLDIAPGGWLQVAEIGGEPCSDCWETTRPYHLELVLDDGEMTLIAEDLVKLTVVPVPAGDETLYKLYRADDLRMP